MNISNVQTSNQYGLFSDDFASTSSSNLSIRNRGASKSAKRPKTAANSNGLRNPFVENSIGNSESTIHALPVKALTLKQLQQQVSHLVEKRFGKNNPRMSQSYTELVYKL